MNQRRSRSYICLVMIVMMSFLQSCGNVDHPRSPSVTSDVGAQDQGPGVGGGGGDYEKDQKPSPEQVRQAIEDARRIVPFVLNHLEGVVTNARAVGSAKYFHDLATADAEIPLATYNLLFPWPRKTEDAQSRWAQTTLRIETAKSCYDDHGNEKAGSALPLESTEICLSIPKITAGAVRVNVVQRVVVLLVHELSHKMGVVDHVLLEKSILAMLPADPQAALKEPLLRLRTSLGDNDAGLFSVVDQTLTALNSSANRAGGSGADWTSVCYGLATIAAATQNFSEPDVLNGVSLALLRPAVEAEKQAVHVRTQIFAAYCAKDSQAPLLESIFRNRSSKPINLGGTGVLSIARGTLRRPEFKNAALLKAELQDTKESLRTIMKAVN